MTSRILGILPIVVAGIAMVAPIVAAAATNGRIWDDSHRLSSRQRMDLDRRLASAARRLGSPVFILVTNRLQRETAASLAARAFTERTLSGAGESNPVLLVVSVGDRAAAIETGKGNAGIVPEIDANQITKDLMHRLRHGDPSQALARAIEAIVVSAEATAVRRRPLPPDEEPPAPAGPNPAAAGAREVDTAGGVEIPDAGQGTAKVTPEHDPSETGRRRSRLPIAVGIAVLVLLALALRRRRQLTSPRPNPRVGP